jgi:hypothetical protein
MSTPCCEWRPYAVPNASLHAPSHELPATHRVDRRYAWGTLGVLTGAIHAAHDGALRKGESTRGALSADVKVPYSSEYGTPRY